MLSPKKRICITVAVAVVISVCLLVLGVVPFAGQVQRSSRAFASQRALLDLISVRIDEVKGFQDDRSSLSYNLNRIESAFIEADSPVVFLNHLETIAQASSLPIKIYPFQSKVTPEDLWLSIGFRVNLGGKVQDGLRFLEALEQSKWLFEVLELNLQKISDRNPYYKEFEELQKGDAYISLTLKAYSGEIPAPEDRSL